MIRFTALIAALFAALAACGPAAVTPEQACRDDAPVSCEKMWTCDAAVKIGDDQASCVTQTQSLCALAAGGCQSGKTYSSAKAAECTQAKKAQTCDQYKAGEPPACGQICT
jgi:hypothetical protein